MSNIYREKDESWNNMGEFAKIQKLGEDLIIVFPKEVVEKLNLEEGCQVEIESFVCCGTSGVRIKSRKDTEI
jgi:antitoxin component of MazEF toxin-antitoxin module